jgi:hypothetical protein
LQKVSSARKFHEGYPHGHGRTTGTRAKLHHVPKSAEGQVGKVPYVVEDLDQAVARGTL